MPKPFKIAQNGNFWPKSSHTDQEFFIHVVSLNVTQRITDLAAGLINFAKNSLMKRIGDKFAAESFGVKLFKMERPKHNMWMGPRLAAL